VETRDDPVGPLLLSLAAHALIVVGLWGATLSCERWNAWVVAAALPEALLVECVKPLDLEGPVIEATLVAYTPPAATVQRPRVQPERPRPQPVPTPSPVVEQPLPPPPTPPPPAQDTIDQERVARDGQLPALEQQREQEERRKREQQLLDEQEQLTRMERERQQQLEDIRRQREEATRRREAEQQRLAQLEDRERERAADQQREIERQRMAELLEREQAEQGQLAGTGGTQNDLRSRYHFAITQQVQRNWLRPDTARPPIRCTIRIAQIPGGEVLDVAFVSACMVDEPTRRSIEAAVRREPLPYAGYESVFTRNFTLDFIWNG
jgi:colicin import membrane protein